MSIGKYLFVLLIIIVSCSADDNGELTKLGSPKYQSYEKLEFLSELIENPLLNYIRSAEFDFRELKNKLDEFVKEESQVKEFLNDFFSKLSIQDEDRIAFEAYKILNFHHGPEEFSTPAKINFKGMVILYFSDKYQIYQRPKEFGILNSDKSYSYLSGYDDILNKLFLLAYPAIGFNLDYYVNTKNFVQVEEQELISPTNFNFTESNQFITKYAEYVPFISQECGSFLAFASAFTLTHLYIKYYKSRGQLQDLIPNSENTTSTFMIEPFHLMACTANDVAVEEKN